MSVVRLSGNIIGFLAPDCSFIGTNEFFTINMDESEFLDFAENCDGLIYVDNNIIN
jgi:hypothetical protein